MKAYLEIVNKIIENGIQKENRTGVNTLSISGMIFEHEMSEGYPLLTTKKMPFVLIASELEFFLKGITDKKWLQDRNNHIWDEWCSPDKVVYNHDEETKRRMMEERELGPVYGWQWRNFGAEYVSYNKVPVGKGFDQIQDLINRIEKDPFDRRLIVSAWNPVDLHRMALPPCHYCFQVSIDNDRLNLMWNQRSVDVALGLPFNIASYALLLHLLAKETGYKEGRLVGFLGDTHIYDNHIKGLKKQIKREPYKLPEIETVNFQSIFDWNYLDSSVKGYESHPRISFKIAV